MITPTLLVAQFSAWRNDWKMESGRLTGILQLEERLG